MGAGRKPGAASQSEGTVAVVDGTSCQSASPKPGFLEGPGICTKRRIPCVPPLPYVLAHGRTLNDDDADYKFFDFPRLSVSLTQRVGLWRLKSDSCLVDEMTTALTALAGPIGVEVVSRFVDGTGKKMTHPPSSPLARMASRSAPFNVTYLRICMDVSRQVKDQTTGGGPVDVSRLSVKLPATHWGLRYGGPLKSGDTEADALRAIIGGTQAEELWLVRFQDDPIRREAKFVFKFVIQDHFGVSESDLYAPPLVAFWVLQHERQGFRPFINEIQIERGLTVSY